MADAKLLTPYDLRQAIDSLRFNTGFNALLVRAVDDIAAHINAQERLIEDLRVAAGADVPSSEILDAAPVVLAINTMYLQDM